MITLVLAAAGIGARFRSETPKQFQLLDGHPLYLRSLQTLESLCERGVVVVPSDWVERIEGQLRESPFGVKFQVVAGGAERQESVWMGLRSLADRNGLVLVHDAARPFVSKALAERVLEGAARCGACIPALPIADTVKEVAGTRVKRTLDRSALRAVQTPQGFQLELLIRAFEKAIKEGFTGTDEASLAERMGAPVEVVEGEPRNKKVTWPQDLR